jgi:hypothetical protein
LSAFDYKAPVMTGRWSKMTFIIIGLVSFVAIFGRALIGLFVRGHLPEQQLSRATQSALTVAVAVIGTLLALVLGLMVSAASSRGGVSFSEIRRFRDFEEIRTRPDNWRALFEGFSMMPRL